MKNELYKKLLYKKNGKNRRLQNGCLGMGGGET